jgi:hypothetical protein
MSALTSLLLASSLVVSGPDIANAQSVAPQATGHEYVVMPARLAKTERQDGWRPNAPALPDEASPVGSRWQDHMDRLVVLRIAAQSKIYFTHNLNRTVVRVATQQPDSGEANAGSAWKYLTTFLKVDPENGEIEDSVVVKTIADFRDVDGDPQGVVTSYCDGIDGACPSWVNETVG